MSQVPDVYEQERLAREADVKLEKHERSLAKMSYEQTIRKYGIGSVAKWAQEDFKKQYPKWKEWDDYYKLS